MMVMMMMMMGVETDSTGETASDYIDMKIQKYQCNYCVVSTR